MDLFEHGAFGQLHSPRGLGVAHRCGHSLECVDAESGAQELLRLLEREQLLERRLPLLVEASFAAFVIDVDLGLGRGPVVVDVGVEEAGIELVDGRGAGRVFSKWRKP